jgi:DNA-binding XRE family transcriptional regulator
MDVGSDAARSPREEKMDARRIELRLTWTQVAERAALNRDTLTAFRAGRGRPNPLTKRGVEDALEWASGSIDSIDGGGEPILKEAAASNERPPGANTPAYLDDHSPSRATPEEIAITLTRAAQRDRELGRDGQLFWATWDVVAEVNHPRQETPTAPARGHRSA